MADDALGDDLVIDDAFIDKVKQDGGRVLNFFTFLSTEEKEELRDDQVITIIENHLNADEITNISLSGCRGITDTAIKHISTRCTNLKTLWYIDCTGCTDAALEAIVHHCSNLEKLYAHNAGITKIPENIGQKLPKLSGSSISCMDANNAFGTEAGDDRSAV
jgi:hypothetical protein